MRALVAVTAFCVVEGQGCYCHSFDHDLTLHWYADVLLRSRNRHPFGIFPHPARHLKTLPSDGGLARQAAGSKDVCREDNVCGVCFVTRNLFCMFAPGRG